MLVNYLYCLSYVAPVHEGLTEETRLEDDVVSKEVRINLEGRADVTIPTPIQTTDVIIPISDVASIPETDVKTLQQLMLPYNQHCN